MRSVALILFMLLFMVVGIAVLHSSLQTWRRAGSSQNWPVAQGQVLSSEVVQEEGYLQSDRASSRGEPTTFYSPHVQYEYVVDGKTYRGERITMMDGSSTDQHRSELIVQEYRPGPVLVHYDPQAPQNALLKPEDVSGIVPGVVIALAMIITPLAFMFISFRYGFIERPPLPILARLWLRQDIPSQETLSGAGIETASGRTLHDDPLSGKQNIPIDADFIESVSRWDLNRRVELATEASPIWHYAVGAAIFGLIVAWVGMMPLTHLIFQRETLHVPEVRMVGMVLFALSGGLAFGIVRVIDRRIQTVFDWTSRTVTQKKELAPTRQVKMDDAKQIVVRCVPVKGRRTKFRAAVELDLGGDRMVVARTCEPRRKQESAIAKASALADPLASALRVPVSLEGWTDDAV
ncbi:MAG: DUF3592 domain-containing protein [Planctomycetales bacterium]|nr:DUF3592 domain-containing protein [Planctomycetales bacterium]